VRLEGGRVRSAEPTAAPRGTSVEVRSLFFNVPARRAFLKSPATELRRALEVVQGYALARPEVRFAVAHEGRLLLEAFAAPDAAAGRRERIGQIFGGELARRLTVIAGAESVGGLVGDPATARGRRQFVFVNRRLVRDRAVLATFYRAVRDEWGSEDFPALFLFLAPPAEQVDVNVHPQKAEVRFRDPGLLDRLHFTLRAALARARGEEPAPLRAPHGEAPSMSPAWRGLGERPYSTAEAWERRLAGTLGEDIGRVATAAYAPLDRPMVPLSGRGGEPRPFRLLGQYKGTLILLEGPDGLYLIDQHVAHERVLYERLRRALAAESPASQTLLHPALLELAPAERLRLQELAAELEECGFGLAVLSGDTLALTAVPAPLSAEEGEALLRALAADEGAEHAGDNGGGGAAPLRRRLVETLAASLACKAAVKMHHPLAPAEMEALVAELFAAEQPYACPHGRPVVLQMTDADLERRFGRR
jgi:DNA mismatch repair protein MutL